MGGRGSLVLLDDPSILATRTGEVARVLAKALRLPLPDVAQRVRNGGGILSRELPDEVAAKAIADLGAAGFVAFVVPPAGAAIALPRSRRLAGIKIEESRLAGSIRGSTKREDLPWPRVRAIHVNAFARELSGEEIDEGRTTRPLPDVKRVPVEILRLTSEIDLWEDRERKRVELCLDVIADDPLLVGRVSAEEADYASLPDKVDSALANFVLLVRALVAAAPPSVVLPPSTRRFAQALDWRGVLYEKPEQRDSFNLWLVLATEHGKPFASAVAVEAAAPAKKSAVADAEDAEDVGDDELEDAETDGDDEEDDDDEDGEDESESESEERPAPVAAKDVEVARALGHFDKTRKLDKGDIAELVAAAQEIDDKAAETDEVPNVEAELQFFEEKKTGRWEVSDFVKESQALEDEDLSDEKNPGA